MARAPTVRSLYAGTFTLWRHTDTTVQPSAAASTSEQQQSSPRSQAESGGSSSRSHSQQSSSASCDASQSPNIVKAKSPADTSPRLIPGSLPTTNSAADSSEEHSLRLWYLPDGDAQFAPLARFFVAPAGTASAAEQLASCSELFVVLVHHLNRS